MIICDFYDYDDKRFNQIEFDVELNAYPCCHFYDMTSKCGNTEFLFDIDNSLLTNSLDNIEKKFEEYLNPEIWEKEPPELCKRTCDKK